MAGKPLIVLGVWLPTETRSFVLPIVFALDGRGKGVREKRASSQGPQGSQGCFSHHPVTATPNVWIIPQTQHVLYVCVPSLFAVGKQECDGDYW